MSLAAAVAGCQSSVWFPNVKPGRSTQLTLTASVYRPAGDAMAPAMVLLHGCDGPHRMYHRWGQWFSRQGYVAVIVDSFGPRRIAEECGGSGGDSAAERVFDTYAALAFLRTQPYVDANRVGVVGWSQGALTALRSSSSQLAQYVLKTDGFKAAVAFYPPGCGSALSLETRTPVLMLLAAADDWTPAVPCVQVAQELRREGVPVETIVYPAATHAFDNPEILGTVTFFGHTLRHDAPATADAQARIRAFLDRHVRNSEARF